MAKTGKDVQGDMLNLLKASGIEGVISGKCYREGNRPKDSKLEDLIVILTTAFVGEIQTGVITIHIYVPDISHNGVYVENGRRTAVLERALQTFIDSLTCGRTNYKFIQQFAVSTENAPTIQQHFVVGMLKYEYYGDDAPVRL